MGVVVAVAVEELIVWKGNVVVTLELLWVSKTVDISDTFD